MISRVADHCFWFGRYVERAESTARLLQATRALVFDADLPVTQCWQPLVIVSGEHDSFRDKYGAEAAGDGERVQEHLTWNPESGVSLVGAVRGARECARAIRDVLSLDTWQAINELYHFFDLPATRQLYREHREAVYAQVRKSTQLTLGFVRSTMLHDEPMSFLWLGAMIERAGQVARMLDMHHHTMEREHAHDIVQVALWMSLLRASSGAEAFMKKNQGRVSAQAVVSFLLHEPSFPRSIFYCLKSSRSLLRSIWADDKRPSTATCDELCAWLDAQRPIVGGDADIHAMLTQIIDQTSAICGHVSTEIQGPARPVRAQTQSQGQTQKQSG
jgi:uncharacterized alpha-E superfamily protein